MTVAEWIEAQLDQAPPLTPESARRLSAVLFAAQGGEQG